MQLWLHTHKPQLGRVGCVRSNGLELLVFQMPPLRLVRFYYNMCLVTICNSSCGKVMFLQVSICPGGVRGRGGASWGRAWQGMTRVWQGGCAWQGGHEWQGACMAWGHAWQGVCMAGGLHGRGACMPVCVYGRRDGHCSRQYASYWNAFLSCVCMWVYEETIVHSIFNMNTFIL